MTRSELIADLRLNHEYCPKEVILLAADMLEADEKAARLALEYLKMYQEYGPPMAFGNTTIAEAIAALKEVLK